MKKFLLLTLLAFVTTIYAQAQQNKEKVAVYVSGNIRSNFKQIISSKAVSRISRSENYVAIERTKAFVDILAKEQDYQLSGEVCDDQIAAVGMRFGVRYVAVFEASQSYDTGFISARIIDVENSTIIKSVDTSRKIKSAEDWEAITNNVAFRLISTKSK